MEMAALAPTALSPVNDPSFLAAQAHLGGTHSNEAVALGFESMFTSLLVKQMRGTLEPDTMFGEDHGEVMGGLFDFYLGQHLAKAGTLGIGAMVRKQLDARKKI